jgi:hypothetical protein
VQKWKLLSDIDPHKELRRYIGAAIRIRKDDLDNLTRPAKRLCFYRAIYVLKLCVMDCAGQALSWPYEAFDVSVVQVSLTMQDGALLRAVKVPLETEYSMLPAPDLNVVDAPLLGPTMLT